jgi:hypothetical protein
MILTTVPVSSTQEIFVELRGSKFQEGRSTSIKANNTDLENLSFSNFLDGAGLIIETALHRSSMYGCQGREKFAVSDHHKQVDESLWKRAHSRRYE